MRAAVSPRRSLPGVEAIDAILAKAAGAGEPGIVAGVSIGGSVVYAAGRGLANLDALSPLTPSSAFRICSISKQFIAALICREIGQRRLSGRDHPSRYIGWLKGADPRLTIRHLLQNQSGLRDPWVLAMIMGAKAEQRFTLEDGNAVMRRAQAGMFAPGDQSLYCNGNFELLGQILEAISGESFAANLKRHILGPLGMRATYLGIDSAEPLPGDVRGYRWHRGSWEEEVNGLHWAASAGIVSTLEDLLKWDGCLRDPVGMGLPWVSRIKESQPFNDGAAASYACGINHLKMNGRAIFAHQGALRGWRSILLRFVREDTAIAVFMNRTNSPHGSLPRAVAYDIVAALGIVPLWGRSEPARLARPPLGWYAEREQGMLVELDAEGSRIRLHLQAERMPLVRQPGLLGCSEDRRTCVQLRLTGAIDVEQRDSNIVARLSRCADRTDLFAARGSFRCFPLESRARIAQGPRGLSIGFTGPFGRGIRYPLHAIDARHAWFEIARGVDESPPGRALVFFDRDANLIEVSFPLARRVVFRKEA